MTHKSLGWTQRVSDAVPQATINPHSPFPLSPAQEGVSPELNTLERGRGANAAITTTQGGALTRWPWATIHRLFKTENWLAVRRSALPCVQQKRYGT